jgi:hypothetical protein
MKKYARVAIIALLSASGQAFAGPADYVYEPAVEYGEREIDFKAGTAKKGDDPRESAASIGFGYGATDYWFTEIYAKYKRANGESAKFDAFEWENKFQLTETGKYPVDVGFLIEIERPKERAEGWEVKWGPLFQTEYGKLQLNGNVLLERSYRAAGMSETELQYQWQTKYRWKKEFEFGLQGFGEVGKWNEWKSREERNHRIGPAVFGKLALGSHQAIRYNAAWLLGASQSAPDHTFRVQVEYEY